MAGTTQYKNNWQKENLDRISLTVPKGQKAQIQSHASAHGESINDFISRAIGEAMDRDQIFEQNRDEIIAAAKKHRVDTDIDMDTPDFKKLIQAFAVLEPLIFDIKDTYFHKLYSRNHKSGVIIVRRMEDGTEVVEHC